MTESVYDSPSASVSPSISMTNEQASRFARKVVENHGGEGIFTVELPAEDLASVAEALRELGCIATIHEHKSWIQVSCPESLRKKSGPHMG
jgi:hypothetical protein